MTSRTAGRQLATLNCPWLERLAESDPVSAFLMMYIGFDKFRARDAMEQNDKTKKRALVALNMEWREEV